MGKYHKVTREEHLKILASRHSVCPVPYTKISKTLGISVRTVRRYAKIQPGEVRPKRLRASMFDPYRAEIEGLLNKEMGKQSNNTKSAMLLFRAAHPNLEFEKTAFYNFVRNRCDLIREPHLARIPLEHDYGEAQIDFCEAVYYRVGRRVNGHMFTMTFVRSGVSFVQLFPAENQQCLFEAMRNIFEYVGFVPQTILFDNASTAVLTTRGKGREAMPTKEYAEFAAWYGFEYRFCNPASGWEKGAVEHANATKRRDYLTPPPFITDEREYNMELLNRCMTDAQEAHYLKGVPKTELFTHEREAGIPLRNKPFDCTRTVVRKTDKCAIIQVDKCRYSVSDKHARKQVMVRIGAFEIDICEMTGKLICRHRRSYKAGSTTIDKTMYADALAARPRARIKRSDNEYVQNDGFLTELNHAVTSVRPAARRSALVEYCESHDIRISPHQNECALLLFNMESYGNAMEDYDTRLQSNSRLVQKAKTG